MKLPHQANTKRIEFDLKGYRAVIITTSYPSLDTIDTETGSVIKKGKATGLYASEMTEAYYTFFNAQMDVDIASIKGGDIPIDPLSLMPLVRTKDDIRFLGDPVLKNKVRHSIPIKDLEIKDYDIVFLSGGWGAAYDFAQSEILSDKITEAYAAKQILASVCHGSLGFIGAQKPDGTALVKDVKVTGVSNRQLKQLLVGNTPKHPETELKKAGALYSCKSGLIEMFQNYNEIDEVHLIVSGQNQKAGIETAQNAMQLLQQKLKKKNF